MQCKTYWIQEAKHRPNQNQAYTLEEMRKKRENVKNCEKKKEKENTYVPLSVNQIPR